MKIKIVMVCLMASAQSVKIYKGIQPSFSLS